MPRSNILKALVAATLTLGGLVACGGPEPKMVATKDDGVPANSASEERLNGSTRPKPKPAEAPEDPSQPLTTPVTGEGSVNAAAAKPGSAKGSGGKEPPAPKGGGGKVTKAECKQLFDRYIDLTIGSDTRFEGIPPEMVAQMKESALAQAQSQKGDPCSTQEVSRAQYSCAIASTSTAGWTRCMK